jgi:L-asparagine transporter-like permease
MSATRKIAVIIYLVFLLLGIRAAYDGDWVVAMFWAIICASENIAVSIDYATWKKKEKEVGE